MDCLDLGMAGGAEFPVSWPPQPAGSSPGMAGGDWGVYTHHPQRTGQQGDMSCGSAAVWQSGAAREQRAVAGGGATDVMRGGGIAADVAGVQGGHGVERHVSPIRSPRFLGPSFRVSDVP